MNFEGTYRFWIHFGLLEEGFFDLVGVFILHGLPGWPKGAKKVPWEVIFEGKGGIPKVVYLRGRPPKASQMKVLGDKGGTPKVVPPLYVPPLPLRGRLQVDQKAVWEKIHPQKTNDSIAVWHFLDHSFVPFGVPVREEFSSVVPPLPLRGRL